MSRKLLLLPLFSLVACTPEAGPTDEADPADVVQPEPCEDPDQCLFEGANTFGDSARKVQVRLPAEPVGAPVVFVFHYLNGSPGEMLAWLGVEELLAEGYIVVAPASRKVPGTEWTVQGDPAKNPDLELFDDLLARLESQYVVDQERIYATGFSAGGLFTTILTMNRGDRLAATAPFSGGVPSALYASPAGPLPVMVAWGGPTDTYGGFDFAAATADFTEALVDDGHEVVACPHTLGHMLPPQAQDHLVAFFGDHGGEGAEPWSQDPAAVPAGCELVDGGGFGSRAGLALDEVDEAAAGDSPARLNPRVGDSAEFALRVGLREVSCLKEGTDPVDDDRVAVQTRPLHVWTTGLGPAAPSGPGGPVFAGAN